ncbi:hypothetical protein OGAPHI_001247 [Ogataea philodendri]|uniref:Importin N-terminal domain-containing protein n=1 Tax=Ogataea philodendri TaxID=1378263 RepID=A0A9P8PF62_9ASCO|nr:uncharacterized protein OGAPHI_001247 [Ogataea philodendri]KAH3670732.1 hypothetical protein OGAPHI_001247 [Ogataea philodendri]
MESQVVQLISYQTSSDNYTRTRAEQEFDQLSRSDPSQTLYTLVVVGTSDQVDFGVRQAALLHIKRLVPKFWSPAFDSYEGPSTVQTEAKQFIRDGLLKLVGDPDSKIRNSASYAITQIAAVDYPDEWPSLLSNLYDMVTDTKSTPSQVLGSLGVLQDLFDDLIPEEQFFEGGVSMRIMQTAELILNSDSSTHQIKAQTLKLLKTVIEILNTAEISGNQARAQFVDQVVPHVLDLLANIAAGFVHDKSSLDSLFVAGLKNELYGCLTSLVTSFPRVAESINGRLLETVLEEINNMASVYVPFLTVEDMDAAINSAFRDSKEFQASQTERIESSKSLVTLIASEIEFLQSLLDLSNDVVPGPVLQKLCALLVQLSGLPVEAQSGFEDDFNEFVSVETELSIETGTAVRDAAKDLLESVTASTNQSMINQLVQTFTTQVHEGADWRLLESTAYLLMCLFSNDTGSEDANVPFKLQDLLEFVINLIPAHIGDSQLFVSRLVLLVPKYILRYESQLETFSVSSLEQILAVVHKLDHGFEIVKAASLISFQYFNHFVRSSQFSEQTQSQLLDLVNQIMNDATEDANIMILESLTIIININNTALVQNEAIFNLCLTIGFRDCSNYSLTASTLECIEDLLKDIPQENYLNLCYKGLEPLLKIIADSKGQYSPELDLSLQVLTVFIKGPNQDSQIPQDVFQFLFPEICNLILSCDDDETLQSSSEVFNGLLAKSSQFIMSYRDPASGTSGDELVLKILSKFLSPSMSDRAIVRLGDLVVLLIQNFSSEASVWQYFEDILKAVTLRLISAKEMITIENLVLIFNTLTVQQPQQTIDFLANFSVDNRPALEKVIPVWLQSFEVMRGYDKILSNIKAFIEIYKLNDQRLKSFAVNGDVIPNQIPDDVIVTRSMSKKMPIKYEQIGADVKIIKLLLSEFKFQEKSAQRAQHAQQVQKPDSDDDDDGWEDLDEVGVPTFEQLRQYAEEDEQTGRSVADNNGDDIRQLLGSFFKECTARNTSGFHEIYSLLSEEDKRFLTEYVAFT